MPNPSGNPLITEYGRSTRFGAGNCPHAARRKASPPWTARKIARAIAGFRPLLGSNSKRGIEDITVADILRCFTIRDEQITNRHIMVAALSVQALHDYRAMDKFIGLVDGA